VYNRFAFLGRNTVGNVGGLRVLRIFDADGVVARSPSCACRYYCCDRCVRKAWIRNEISHKQNMKLLYSDAKVPAKMLSVHLNVNHSTTNL
jgi:hypothetical protein